MRASIQGETRHGGSAVATDAVSPRSSRIQSRFGSQGPYMMCSVLRSFDAGRPPFIRQGRKSLNLTSLILIPVSYVVILCRPVGSCL
jgi:hypothetical protein